MTNLQENNLKEQEIKKINELLKVCTHVCCTFVTIHVITCGSC